MHIEFKLKNDTIAIETDVNNFIILKKTISPDPDTGEDIIRWVGISWHASLAQALTKVSTLKIKESEARTLDELRQAVERVRNEILEVWDTARLNTVKV